MPELFGVLIDYALFEAYRDKRDAEHPEQLKLYWGAQTKGVLLQLELPGIPPVEK